MLDFAFDHAMVGANARREGKPASQHVSIKGGALRIRSNNDYRRDLLVDMLQTVGYLGIGLGLGVGVGIGGKVRVRVRG